MYGSDSDCVFNFIRFKSKRYLAIESKVTAQCGRLTVIIIIRKASK